MLIKIHFFTSIFLHRGKGVECCPSWSQANHSTWSARALLLFLNRAGVRGTAVQALQYSEPTIQTVPPLTTWHDSVAPELAPVIMDIYNWSPVEGYVPGLLKSSIVNPLPILIVSPPQEIKSDLRPIALTCTIAKVMEVFMRNRVIKQIAEKIEPRQ